MTVAATDGTWRITFWNDDNTQEIQWSDGEFGTASNPRPAALTSFRAIPRVLPRRRQVRRAIGPGSFYPGRNNQV